MKKKKDLLEPLADVVRHDLPFHEGAERVDRLTLFRISGFGFLVSYLDSSSGLSNPSPGPDLVFQVSGYGFRGCAAEIGVSGLGSRVSAAGIGFPGFGFRADLDGVGGGDDSGRTYTSFYVSMYLCICVSLYPYIYVSMYLCIYVSMYLCIYLSVHLSIAFSFSLSLPDSLYKIIYAQLNTYTPIYTYRHIGLLADLNIVREEDDRGRGTTSVQGWTT